jgi:hypothetical protein
LDEQQSVSQLKERGKNHERANYEIFKKNNHGTYCYWASKWILGVGAGIT